MGNQCCKGQQSVATQQKALPPEPPLRKGSTYDPTQSDLAAQVNSFTVFLSETLRQGKKLSEHVASCKTKTASLLTRADANVKKYQGKIEGVKSEAGFPQETVQFFVENSAEIEEMIQILSNLRKNTVLRYENSVSLFREKLAKLQEDKTECNVAIATRLATRHLSKEDEEQATELNKSIIAISPSLDQAETYQKEIKENNSEVEASLARVPDLLTQLKAFQKIIPESSEHVELIIEEVQSQPIVDEFQMEEEVNVVVEDRHEEVSLAAEAPQDLVLFDDVYNELTEASEFLAGNAVFQVYSKHKNELLPAFDEETVYHTFGEILTKKQESEMALDLFTVQYFLTEFPESPFNSLVQFVEGVKTMLSSNAIYGRFIANFIGVFDPKPFSRIVVDIITELGKTLDGFIKDTDRRKRVELGRELTEAELQEKLVSGGKVALSSVLNMAYPLFEDYPKYGQDLLELLRPALVETAEFLNFLLVHRMKDRSLDGISFFKLMATNDSVSFSAFSKGIHTILKLWISEEAIETLFYAIRSPDKEDIHRVELVKSLRLQKFVDQQKSDAFQLPKYQVLEAFGEILRTRRLEVVPSLFSKYQKHAISADSLSVEQLESVLKDLGEENVEGILKETEKKNSTFKDLVRLVESYGVKSYADSFFCKVYIVPIPVRRAIGTSIPEEVVQAISG